MYGKDSDEDRTHAAVRWIFDITARDAPMPYRGAFYAPLLRAASACGFRPSDVLVFAGFNICHKLVTPDIPPSLSAAYVAELRDCLPFAVMRELLTRRNICGKTPYEVALESNSTVAEMFRPPMVSKSAAQ